MNDSNKQTAATLNQIDNEKPNINKKTQPLTGYIGGSLNAGINKVISYKKVMAGERHKQMNMEINLQLLTPLTPMFQKLRGEILTFFVPDSRVWENAEKYTAQRGGSTEEKIEKVPSLRGKTIPILPLDTGNTEFISIVNTNLWRDTFIGSYIPRVGRNEPYENADDNDDMDFLPDYNGLPLRGIRAIYNDFLRNKEYDEEQFEYKGDEISDEEWQSYLPTDITKITQNQLRARRNNSYFTDYRTELQGIDEDYPNESLDGTALTNANKLVTWLAFENLVAEARSQSENAQLNTWDIIAKIRGSKKLTEGKVQLIGRREIELNYNAITQNAYNNNENINEEFRVLGKQGAYSYTYLKIPIYAGMQFNEEGFIHVILHVYADTVYENALERTLMNVTPLDEYRPDLANQKDDVLYQFELGTKMAAIDAQNALGKAVGFKRKYTEYFKLPNCINGDMTSPQIFEFDVDKTHTGNIITTQNTYQFYMQSASLFIDPLTYQSASLNIWQDYTDLLLNKNQAIQNEFIYKTDIFATKKLVMVIGQNQIFYAGKLELDAELPIENSEAIINNYTTWGEH